MIEYVKRRVQKDMKVLAERIKDLRESNYLTQQQLGKAVGYDQSRVAKWENGSLEPNPDTLVALSKFFNVSVDYLLGLEND